MRRTLSFRCEDIELIGSIDEAVAATGLLVVTGGTQVRAGTSGGLARLAATVAAAGYPALRFDRRGIGDSGGNDPGFRGSGPDIAAAAAALRAAQPHVTRIAAFGLCDGASALALHARAAGVDAMLLANPWVVEPAAGLPPPAAIRRRYRERLTSGDAWRRLLGGRVDLGKAVRGLHAAARAGDDPLAEQIARSLRHARLPATVLLAERDATAIAFADAARRTFGSLELATEVRTSASHGFAAPGDADWLAARVIDALGRV